MASIHAMRHNPHRKRRLFAGRLETAFLREERLRKLQEGHKPRRRKLFAGRVETAYRREVRLQELEQGKGRGRLEFSKPRGEFKGYVKDPRVRRSRRTR